MRTVAVTGATGFIGRHLAAALLSRGVDVRAIVRPESSNPVPAGASIVRAPLEAGALREACAGVDAVVHLAGIVQAGRASIYQRTNVDATREVARAARDAGALLVHVSSLAAAGPAPASAPARESDPPRPITAYGHSKLASERVVRETDGLRWTILRPGAVYGPGDRAVLPLFRLVHRGVLPMVGDPSAAYTFVHVDDMVAAAMAALDGRAEREVLFVGHPEPVTTADLIATIEAALGRKALRVPVPRPLVAIGAGVGDLLGRISGSAVALNRSRYAEMRAGGFVCRVDLLKARLGVEATIDLASGMAATAAWYRQAGWL